MAIVFHTDPKTLQEFLLHQSLLQIEGPRQQNDALLLYDTREN